jgi:hypothetical protein
MRVALQGQSPNGYIHIWVDGTKRWEHNNIYTNGAGEEIEYFDLNATFNNTIFGPNQKRYWDSFSVSVTRAG